MNVRVLENKLQGSSLFSVPTLQAALSGMPQNEAAPALLEIAENAEQKRRDLRKNVVVTIILLLSVSPLRLALLFSPLHRKMSWQIAGALLNVAPLIAFSVAEWFFSPRKVVQTQQNAIAALLICPNETRFLPHLVDGLHAGKAPEWKTVLYPALTAALWNAPYDDLVLRLDATRRNALRAFVAYDFPAFPFAPLIQSKTLVSPHFDDVTTDLTVAAMRTLVTVGDKKTVKVLEIIIKTEGNLRNETVVRDAAREFLPVLRKRIEENKEIFRRLRTLTGDQAENPDATIAIQTYVDTLPQETAPVLLADYLMEQKQRAARARVWAGVGLVVSAGAIAAVYLLSTQQNQAGLIGGLCAMLGTTASFLSILRRPNEETQAGKIAYELVRRSGDDTRLLPALLYSMPLIVDKKQSEAVEKAIVHLLPLLHVGDAALVSPHLRRTVRAWLTMPRGLLGRAAKNKAIVALDALAAIGDTVSLRRVESVARYAETARHGDFLRQTAMRCADALKARKPLA